MTSTQSVTHVTGQECCRLRRVLRAFDVGEYGLSTEIVHALRSQLSWVRCREFIAIDDSLRR